MPKRVADVVVDGSARSHHDWCQKRQALEPAEKRQRVGEAVASRSLAVSPQIGGRHRATRLATAADESVPFVALTIGPYFVMASFLDATDLCKMDAACQSLLALNGQPVGPWRSTGEREFTSMELDVDGGFLPVPRIAMPSLIPLVGAGSWKARYEMFTKELLMFSAPFRGRAISNIRQPDEVVYCRCRIRSDTLATTPDSGIYVEVQVTANADNLSLAVVDFEGGGQSSVTFSPETGAVLRERKIRDLPRAIEGDYIHLLPASRPGHRFFGHIGMYVHSSGHIAFFRKWAEGSAMSSQWQTTGLCTDLSWAQGERLSLCLAFRDNGMYGARLVKVCREPPIVPPRCEMAYRGDTWSLLYGDDDHPLAI